MFKPVYTRLVPPGAKRKLIGGVPHVQLKHDGKMHWFPLSSGGRARVPHSDWHGRIRLANGTRVTVRFVRNRSASETMQHNRQQLEDNIAAGKIVPPVYTDKSVPELVEKFVQEKKAKGIKLKTVQNTHPVLKRIVAGLKLQTLPDVRALNSGKVLAWCSGMRASYTTKDKAPRARLVEPATRANYVNKLNQFLFWLHEQRLIPEVPKLPVFSSAVTCPRRALSIQEVEKLAQASPWPRNILYRLAFATLGRKTALLSLRAEDLNLNNPGGAFVIFRPEHAKTKKGQTVPVPARLVPELRRLVTDMGGGSFGQLVGRFKAPVFDKDLKLAGISKKTADGVACFHSLRHGGATHLAKSGVSLLLIKEMGGWHNLNIVAKHYAHLSALSERSSIDTAMSLGEHAYTIKRGRKQDAN